MQLRSPLPYQLFCVAGVWVEGWGELEDEELVGRVIVMNSLEIPNDGGGGREGVGRRESQFLELSPPTPSSSEKCEGQRRGAEVVAVEHWVGKGG